MSEEKNIVITYKGNQISMFSENRDDYINITEMAIANRNRKSIRSWLRNKATLAFLTVWEQKHNRNFVGAHLGAEQIIEDRDEVSIKNWIEKTNAIGIRTRTGTYAGTYAHKDIAIKFAAWLNPEFELWLIEKVQELRTLEDKKNSYDLLSHEQILYLIRLKEVFKYVAHQNMVEDAHKDVFAAHSNAKNPFAEFHVWRNKILDIAPQTIDDRIKQYCIENHIAITNKLLKKPKNEKILMLDSYEAVRNAVWDFLKIGGEVNALNLANLVGDMIRTEKGEIIRSNEDNLFSSKQNLAEFNDLAKILAEHPDVQTAREVLKYRDYSKGKLNDSEKKKLFGEGTFGKLLGAVARAGKPEKD
jgi:hypothetical protein